jgi:hypothetical protein
MSKKNLHKERADLLTILKHYESGGVTHFGDDNGAPTSEMNKERIALVKRRIADLDEKIARAGNA